MNNTKSLEELFNNRIFRVPDYQRGYAWEWQQVEEFLADLELLSPNRRHYTGTIVLHQPEDTIGKSDSDNEGTNYAKWHIVDGQQRFTTIVLLLNEISRALSKYESSHDLAQGIKKKYVEATDLDGLPLHKLSLNEDTDDFFKKSILPESPSIAGPQVESAQRLLNAKEQIAEHLCEKEGSEQSLRGLYRKVTTRLHFNLYEVEKEAEVGVIFEVMNSRGKPLTELEKVKNYLLYAASSFEDVTPDNRDKFASSVNQAWACILKQLMAADLGSPEEENRMLRAHWLMQYDPQPKNWKGHGSIRSEFDLREYQGNHTELLRELHGYVNGLRDACICFCDALSPARSNAFDSFNGDIRSDIIRWNEKLVRIGVTATFLPLLMAARTRWPAEPEKYLEIVKLCELFAFRIYQAGDFRSNYGQAALFRIAHEVVVYGMESDDTVRQVKKEMNSRANSRFDAFTNIEEPEPWYWWPGLRYFLYEYEQHLASARGVLPKVSWEEIGSEESIEHVLPQTITNQPYWQQYFDADTHKKYVHDIGNLVLTRDNSSLSNKPFPDKKGTFDAEWPCYAASSLFQERELARQDDWTPQAIDERRARLLDWAKRRWYVDFSDIYPEPDGIEDEPDDSAYDDDNGEEE